jgi:signal transduction histidine kinase
VQPGGELDGLASWGFEGGLPVDLDNAEKTQGAQFGADDLSGALPGRVHWMEATIQRWLPVALKGRLHPEAKAVEAAASKGLRPEGLAMVSHDVRNMLAALDLYCDLLEEPGVLGRGFGHYAGELRLVAASSRTLVEKLRTLEMPERGGEKGLASRAGSFGEGVETRPGRMAAPLGGSAVAADGLGTEAGLQAGAGGLAGGAKRGAAQTVKNLAEELLVAKNLLAALAGPGTTLGMHFYGGARPVGILGEDLTRVLVNLVKNSSEAMPTGGHIQIGVREEDGRVRISVSDTGCGIPEQALEAIFAPGYSTRVGLDADESMWPAQHHGLGLAIVRSLVTAAGGSVWAGSGSEEGEEDGGGDSGLTAREGSMLSETGDWNGGRGATVYIEFPILD